MNIDNFHFIRPDYLWLFSLILFVYIITKIANYFKSNLNFNNNWGKICNPEIINFLYKNNQQSYQNHFLAYLISILLIIALSGPTWSKHDVPLYQNKDAWIIMLSLSNTMNNTDVTPNRLQRAKYKISDFLKELSDQQISLIIYTNNAFDLIPLTTDKKTIEHILPSIDPLIMPTPGDNVNSALVLAENIIKKLNLLNCNILLLSDSNANSQSLLTAKRLGGKKIAINIINLNKDHQNFNNSLKELSTLSSGLYQDLTNNDQDLTNLLEKTKLSSLTEAEKKLMTTEVWHDFGPWLLFLILPLLLFYLNKHHRNLIILALILTSALPQQSVYASNIQNNFNNIWHNKQQIAAEQLKSNSNNTKINSKIFKTPRWQAAAEYSNQQYSTAEQLLINQPDPTSIYNYANALAKQGKVQEAIANYDKALKLDPNNSDAKFNKELLEQYQKQKQKQNQTNKKNQQNQNSDNQSQDNNQSKSKSESESESENQSQSNQNKSQDKNNPTENKPKESSKENSKENQAEKQQQADKTDKTDKNLEKWLNKIPDNPAIYLRNQLQYEYWRDQQR